MPNMTAIWSNEGYLLAGEHDILHSGDSAYALACRYADEYGEWVELDDEDGDRYIAPQDANGTRPIVAAEDWED